MSPPIDAQVNQPPPIQVEITQQNGVTVQPDKLSKTPISTSNNQILSSQKCVKAPGITTPVSKKVTITKATKASPQVGSVGTIILRFEYKRVKLPILFDGQTDFTVETSVSNPVNTFLYLNGVEQEYGVDYSMLAYDLTWISDVPLETDDVLEVYYSPL